jgi:hypothetical protein
MSFRICRPRTGAAWAAVLWVAAWAGLAPAQTNLRVVTWNTANSTGSAGTDPRAPVAGGSLAQSLQAMGALNTTGFSRPVDILAMQESVYYTGSGVNPTAQAVVNILNGIYGAGTYAAGTLNGTTTGPNANNGPNTVVYRTTTVSLINQQALGTPSGSGVARQVMKYQFQSVANPSVSFHVYNSHMKAGTTAEDNTRRGVEAGIIMASANALPANTPILFLGDYNPTNDTADLGYQGVVGGTAANRGIDPLNPTNVTQDWDSAAFRSYATLSPVTTATYTGQSTVGMRYRDDVILNSPGMLSGNSISYVNGSHTIFGNTGTHTYQGTLASGSTAAFAALLPGYTQSEAAGVINQLALTSDHLPVITDYVIAPVPEPACVIGIVSVIGAVWWRKRK